MKRSLIVWCAAAAVLSVWKLSADNRVIISLIHAPTAVLSDVEREVQVTILLKKLPRWQAKHQVRQARSWQSTHSKHSSSLC
jgi:hypothetical protein